MKEEEEKISEAAEKRDNPQVDAGLPVRLSVRPRLG